MHSRKQLRQVLPAKQVAAPLNFHEQRTSRTLRGGNHRVTTGRDP